MRIVQLSEQEAANSAVMENVAKYLLTGEPSAVAHVHVATQRQELPTLDVLKDKITPQTGAQALVPSTPALVAVPPAPIGVDAPDVGVEQPVVPLASPFAHLGFGSAPVPASPLPTAPAVSAPSAVIAAGVELDSAKLYWDERIHSSSKDKNKDGTWRKKRGVEDKLGAAGVAAVEAEIRAILAIPSVPSVPHVPAVPSVPLPPAGTTVVETPVPAAPPADEHAFTRWMEELAPEMAPGGRFTPDLLTKLIAVQGLDPALGLMVYTKRADLVPAARDIVAGWMNDPTTVPQ